MTTTCPLCNCSLMVYHSTENWYWCAACELHFVSPQPSEAELSEFYSNFVYNKAFPSRRFWDLMTKWRAKHRYDWLKQFIPKTGTMLDVGCGDWAFVNRFKKEGWQAAGLEYGDSVGDVSFDLIVFSHVLEHVPGPVDTLRHFAEHLNDGGLIYVEVPRATRSRKFMDWHNQHSFDTSRHLFTHTDYSLFETVLHAGLIPRHIKRGIWLPFGLNPNYIGMVAGKVKT